MALSPPEEEGRELQSSNYKSVPTVVVGFGRYQVNKANSVTIITDLTDKPITLTIVRRFLRMFIE